MPRLNLVSDSHEKSNYNFIYFVCGGARLYAGRGHGLRALFAAGSPGPGGPGLCADRRGISHRGQIIHSAHHAHGVAIGAPGCGAGWVAVSPVPPDRSPVQRQRCGGEYFHRHPGAECGHEISGKPGGKIRPGNGASRGLCGFSRVPVPGSAVPGRADDGAQRGG